VVGVLADLSGSNSGSLAPIAGREWTNDVTAENFDAFMKKSNVGVDLEVPDLISGKGGKMRVNATIEQMRDFEPDRLAEIIGMEPVEIFLTEEGKGKEKRYVFDPANEASAKFDESVNSLDDITLEYVAAKLGVDPESIDVKKVPAQDKKRGKFWILRIEKKGPIAKLLEARRAVKELLTKMDVGDAREMEKLLGDKSYLEQYLAGEGKGGDQ
jgi:predicted component of type VI protein secretion system